MNWPRCPVHDVPLELVDGNKLLCPIEVGCQKAVTLSDDQVRALRLAQIPIATLTITPSCPPRFRYRLEGHEGWYKVATDGIRARVGEGAKTKRFERVDE